MNLPAQQRPDSGEAGHLLVVDDNAANRYILNRHLEQQGYTIRTAESGRLALEAIQSESFDLVLLDVLMPGLDGFEVLTRMKDDPRMNGIPVIMISALDESASVIRCIQMGAEDYLTKPFDPVLLGARLSASLEKKRLRDKEKKKTEELEKALNELHRTQDQLLVQEKLASLGSLTAGIAHEIKNPLNFVNNFAVLCHDLIGELQEALHASRPDEEAIAGIIADLDQNVIKIEEHGKRADRIVRGMLLHSRGSSSVPEKVDINGLLVECVNLAYHGLRAQNPEFDVQMKTDLEAAIPPVCVFAQELSRVFLNLVNNACYAAQEKKRTASAEFAPQVVVSSRSRGNRVIVRVWDNGVGIPDEIRPKLFVPFFTTKPAGSGTGLGLSISYEIVVKRHRGELLVESKPGEFTEFTVILSRESQHLPC